MCFIMIDLPKKQKAAKSKKKPSIGLFLSNLNYAGH